MEITRKMAEEAWRENPPSQEYVDMMSNGGEYRVPIRTAVSAYVGGLRMALEPEMIDAPYIRFRIKRIGPERMGIIANDKWLVQSVGVVGA